MKLLFLSFYFEPDLCAGSFRNTPLFQEIRNQLGKDDFIHVITTQPNRYKTFHASAEQEERGDNYIINRITIPEHKSGMLDQAKSFAIFYWKAIKLVKGRKYDLVYASSSSVYGSNKKVPYSTDDKVDNPVSLYAATKKSNELMAHAYSKLYNISSTGLRFFTVYGPAGRPDMAYFGFTNKLREGKTIRIFNYGNCKRDFTYVDDIVEGVVRIMQHAPEKHNGEDGLPIPPYKIYNIGNNSPENLLDFVTILQEELIRAGVLPKDYDFDAHKELVPMQPGDVPVTYADTTHLEQDFDFKPSTSLREGLRKFAGWYAKYYGVQ